VNQININHLKDKVGGECVIFLFINFFCVLIIFRKDEKQLARLQWNHLANILFDALESACSTGLCSLIDSALDCMQVRL
jgi:hypothetical protein